VGKRATHQNSLLGGVFPENVSIVDIYNEATLRQNSQYAADRFHPSQEGYVKWSAAFISATTKAS
jgi:lysophospholipase L1-like esterase